MAAPRHAIFISYRRRDSIYAVDRLDERLKRAFGSEAVFRDVRSIRKGQSFPDDIRAALGEAMIGIVVIGPWWMTIDDAPAGKRPIDNPDDWVRVETVTLLVRKGPTSQPIPVIPLLIGGASVPKAEDLPDSLKTLRQRDGQHLRPEPDFEESVRQLIDHVGQYLGVAPRPFAPHGHDSAEKPPRVSPTRLSVTGRKFVGREQELHILDEAWGRSRTDKINIVSFIGQGGEGKTAVVLEWYSRRAHNGWQGAQRVFDWSFYSQGTSAQTSASADDFFSAAFNWFGYTGEVPKDSWTKGGKLAELIAAERTLLVLDGLEPLQQPPGGYGGEFKDPAMKALLRGLALNNPGLCILTSRTDITDLSPYEHADGSCLRHPLHSLDLPAARALLRELGVLGPEKELDEAIEYFNCHAYDLNLLGNYLAKCTNDHDIRGWQQWFAILREDGNVHPRPDKNGKREGRGRRMLRSCARWFGLSSRSTSADVSGAYGSRPGEYIAGKRTGHGRRMLRAYELWLGTDSPAVGILRLLGLFDRPARSDMLDELRAGPVIPGLTEALVPLSEDEWLRTVDGLARLSLISRQPMSLPPDSVGADEGVELSADDVPDELVEALLRSDDLPAEVKNMPKAEIKRLWARAQNAERKKRFKVERPRRPVNYIVDAHPLLREHFAAELRETRNEARRQGHRRLFEYLCQTTPDKPEPTLEDLQPLYQAVAHGCRAGLQQDACGKVYRDRILRGTGSDGFYSTKKLGAYGSDLGAVACFFEQPWSRVSPALTEAEQAWLLNAAAFRLRALGRLTEALEPMRAGLEAQIKQEVWESAAVIAGNLSELELTLGMVDDAVKNGKQSVTYADRSGDASQQMIKRTTHADALHQAGRRAEAEALFREAETMQTEVQPEYPLLYSLRGFQYCDLLLATAERAAWHATLLQIGKGSGPSIWPVTQEDHGRDGLAMIRDVAQRAAMTLQWMTGSLVLLDIASGRLTVNRTALYEAILAGSSLDGCREPLKLTVDDLRRASAQHHLPRGLLNRAWMVRLTNLSTGPSASSASHSDSAQADLDEAWEIAERGSMKLHMADIHLHRARLFFRQTPYPWVSPQADLAAARKLIESCGYWRRKEELEDAEAVING